MLKNSCSARVNGCFDDRIIARSIIECLSRAVILAQGIVGIAKKQIGLTARRGRAKLLHDKPKPINWLPVHLLLRIAVNRMAVIALKIVVENARKIRCRPVAVGLTLAGPPPEARNDRYQN